MGDAHSLIDGSIIPTRSMTNHLLVHMREAVRGLAHWLCRAYTPWLSNKHISEVGEYIVGASHWYDVPGRPLEKI